MAIAFVQQAVNHGSTATLAVTLGSAPTNGNVLVACIANQANTLQVQSIAQTGVTWAFVTRGTTNEDLELWVGAVSSGAGTTVTITFNGTGTNCANVSEWSGMAGGTDGAAAFNNGVTANNTNAWSSSTGAYTSVTIDLIYVASVQTRDQPASSITAGYTLLTAAQAGGTSISLTPGFNILLTSGAQSATFNFASGTTGAKAWQTVIVGFPAAVPFWPEVLPVTPWPPIDYIPAPLKPFRPVAGGPPPQTNWQTKLDVVPWPPPQYPIPDLIHIAPVTPTVPSVFTPALLAVAPWPAAQYPPVNLPQPPTGTGPYFPAPLAVAAWAPAQYPPVDVSQVAHAPVGTGPYFPTPLAVAAWAPAQYPPVDLSQVAHAPVSAVPYFPALLPVASWPAPQYPALDLLRPPTTPAPGGLTGIKFNLRGVKRRPKEP